MTIERLSGASVGRSRASAWRDLLFVVANSSDVSLDFGRQASETLAVLDKNLADGGSSRSRILSLQVLLQNIQDKPAFDDLWIKWIGAEQSSWPQRSCYQVGLTPGLLIEIVAIAARDEPEA
jgi:enamine deaminase RidA (YjgF/YER057c/UK114 family)